MQRERYFETQSAKYWNSSASGDCPNTDDSEGITLSSLGKTKINYFKITTSTTRPKHFSGFFFPVQAESS